MLLSGKSLGGDRILNYTNVLKCITWFCKRKYYLTGLESDLKIKYEGSKRWGFADLFNRWQSNGHSRQLANFKW